jgi:hypothetical protein
MDFTLTDQGWPSAVSGSVTYRALQRQFGSMRPILLHRAGLAMDLIVRSIKPSTNQYQL